MSENRPPPRKEKGKINPCLSVFYGDGPDAGRKLVVGIDENRIRQMEK